MNWAYFQCLVCECVVYRFNPDGKERDNKFCREKGCMKPCPTCGAFCVHQRDCELLIGWCCLPKNKKQADRNRALNKKYDRELERQARERKREAQEEEQKQDFKV